MKRANKSVTVPATATTGIEVPVQHLAEMWLHIVNTNWVGVLTVKGSLDGTVFGTLYTVTYAGGSPDEDWLEIPQALLKIRIDVTTDTSGTEPIANVAGWNRNS